MTQYWEQPIVFNIIAYLAVNIRVVNNHFILYVKIIKFYGWNALIYFVIQSSSLIEKLSMCNRKCKLLGKIKLTKKENAALYKTFLK